MGGGRLGVGGGGDEVAEDGRMKVSRGIGGVEQWKDESTRRLKEGARPHNLNPAT